MRKDAEAIEKQILRHLADGKRGETLRSGLKCSLVGPPNAGKSSLLNLLAARPAAIVSSIPGTTRDIVSVRLEIGGVAVAVDDTAGLRGEGADEVEEEGMRRSAASFRKAQLRVIVLDGGSLTPDTVSDDFFPDSFGGLYSRSTAMFSPILYFSSMLEAKQRRSVRVFLPLILHYFPCLCFLYNPSGSCILHSVSPFIHAIQISKKSSKPSQFLSCSLPLSFCLIREPTCAQTLARSRVSSGCSGP